VITKTFNSLNLGVYDKALEYNLESLDMKKKLFKGDHKVIVQSLYNTGVIYSNMKNEYDALRFKLESLDMGKRLFGINSLSITKLLVSCAISYNLQNNFKKALQLSTECLEIQIQNFNKIVNMANKKALEKTYNLVSKIYCNAGKISQLKEFKLEYLNILQRFYDNKDHLDISKVLFDLGLLLENINVYQSLDYHFMCLEMRHRLCKKDHPLVLKSSKAFNELCIKTAQENQILKHNNSNLLAKIGKVCLKNQDYKKAQEYFQQALNTLGSDGSSNFQQKADYLCLIGVALSKDGNHLKALEYKFECLRLLQTFNNDTNENINVQISKALFSIAVSYSILGEYSMSLDYDLKSLRLREKIYQKDDFELVNSLFGVGASYSNLGMHNEALIYKLKGKLLISDKIKF